MQGRQDGPGQGDHARPVRLLGLGPVEARGQFGAAREHDVVRTGMGSGQEVPRNDDMLMSTLSRSDGI